MRRYREDRRLNKNDRCCRAKRKDVLVVESTMIINNNDDMSLILKMRYEEAQKYEPMIVKKNGHYVFRKTEGNRRSMLENYLREKYSYDNED